MVPSNKETGIVMIRNRISHALAIHERSFFWGFFYYFGRIRGNTMSGLA